jgi:hypothetical protein
MNTENQEEHKNIEIHFTNPFHVEICTPFYFFQNFLY